ncbi:MAG: MFS transporter, partial [Solirubrobacteraceae bacterium]
VVLTGTFMVVLDFFIVNVALPSMQRSLHASAGSVEWVAAGYALSSAVLLIAGGRLGDRFGRRRVFAVGMRLFTLSSGLCGTAPDATVLVIGRLVQGLGGALPAAAGRVRRPAARPRAARRDAVAPARAVHTARVRRRDARPDAT